MTLDFQDNSFDVSKGISNDYTLPVASATTLGGVKIDDDTIKINDDTISAPALDDFLPPGTTITVKTDGTGDYTNLTDAINYLTGKWSNGEIKILLSAETHTIDSEGLSINGRSINVPKLTIQGATKTTTILSYSGTGNAFNFNLIRDLTIQDLTLQNTADSIGGNGIRIGGNSWAYIDNVLVEGFSNGVVVDENSGLQLFTAVDFKNVNTGVHSTRFSKVVSNGSSVLSFNTATYAWRVTIGGMIALSTPISNITYTSTTNKCSQTVGQFNANGIIGGTLQN